MRIKIGIIMRIIIKINMSIRRRIWIQIIMRNIMRIRM